MPRPYGQTSTRTGSGPQHDDARHDRASTPDEPREPDLTAAAFLRGQGAPDGAPGSAVLVRKVPFYPNVMVPLQIDLARAMRRYR